MATPEGHGAREQPMHGVVDPVVPGGENGQEGVAVVAQSLLGGGVGGGVHPAG